MNPTEAEQRLAHIQNCYHQWCQLQRQLQVAHAQWQTANALMREMQQFYFEGEFAQINEQIEAGEPIRLPEDTEYSIMAEDTLWNAHHEHQQLAWQWLRSSMNAIDPEQN